MVKNLPANAGDVRDVGSILGAGRSKREWQPASVFLPGESHGQRTLVGYSSWGHKDRTQLSDFTFLWMFEFETSDVVSKCYE